MDRRAHTHNRRDGLFGLLALAVALEAVGVGMLYPLLARIQDAHHLPTYGLGLMSGSNFFAALLAQVGVSRFLDGRRAGAILVGGLTLGVAAAAWFGLASTLWAFSASRALGGVSYGIVMPAALKASTTGVSRGLRGSRLGRLSSAQMSGIVLGPLLGTGLAEAGGVSTPFLVLAGATAAVTLVFLVLEASGAGLGALTRRAGSTRPAADGATPAALDGRGVTPAPEVPAKDTGAEATCGAPPGAAPPAGVELGQPGSDAGLRPAQSRRPSPLSRPVLGLLLLAVAAQLPTGLYDALWSRLLTDRGADTLLIGISLTLFGIPFVALAPLGGRLAGRRAPLAWAVGALLIAGCFMASYGFVPSPLVITALGALEACAQAVAVPGAYAAVSATFPDRFTATGQGWFSAAGTTAAGLAAVSGAPIFAAVGPGPLFAGGAAVSMCFALAAGVVGRRRPPGSGRGRLQPADPARIAPAARPGRHGTGQPGTEQDGPGRPGPDPSTPAPARRSGTGPNG